MTHAAYNLTTGEVFTTNHVNHLKRRVAKANAWDMAHGYGKSVWMFAHGANWQAQFADRLARR